MNEEIANSFLYWNQIAFLLLYFSKIQTTLLKSFIWDEGMLVHYNPVPQEAETGGSGVQAGQDYVERLCHDRGGPTWKLEM